VVLALADRGLDDAMKQAMAVKLHGLERKEIEMGKPAFPFVNWSGEEIIIPSLDSFISHKSWLIFDMLGLTGPQVLDRIFFFFSTQQTLIRTGCLRPLCCGRPLRSSGGSRSLLRTFQSLTTWPSE
jgi:hypothetical protein